MTKEYIDTEEEAFHHKVQLSNKLCSLKLRAEKKYIGAFLDFKRPLPFKESLKKHIYGNQLKYVAQYRSVPAHIRSLGFFLLSPQMDNFEVSINPGHLQADIAHTFQTPRRSCI